MVYVLRFMFFALFSVVSISANALPLQARYQYQYQTSSDVYGTDPADVCARGVVATGMQYKYSGVEKSGTSYNCKVTWTFNGGGSGNLGAAVPAGNACPANSAATGANCTCSAGYVEQGNQCVKKKSEVCGPLQGMGTGISSIDSDFGTQSAKWAGSKIGTSANSCMAGCQVSGKVDTCVVGTGNSSSTVCYLSGTSFTGDVCTNSTDGGGGGTDDSQGADKDKPSDCPVGYEPSKYAPGVCIPKPNDCPSGSSPSKYAEGVCIPDEKGDDGSCEDPKDPTKRAECEGNKNKCPSGQVQSTTQVGTCVPGTDSTGKDKDGNKVECKDGKCTITKPDGSKEDKDKKSVCAENPDLPACKENKSTFGGSCMGGFSCEGDALQCAIAKEQHRRNCELFEKDTDSNSLTNKALNGTDDKSAEALKASAAQLNVTSSFDQSGLGWSHSCPADPRIPLGFGGSNTEFTIPFSRICGPLGVLSLAGVGITLLGCGVWVLGGKKGS